VVGGTVFGGGVGGDDGDYWSERNRGCAPD
jgi:hypothetical protein